MRIDFRKWFPYVIAVVVFLCVSYVYFAPLLEGKVVRQHDRDQWNGTAKELIDYRAAHGGEQSHWTSTVFGGMPSVLVSMEFPRNVVGFVDRVLQFGSRPACYIFITILGFYLLLLVLKVNPWLAFAGALGYGFSTYFFIIIGAGHNAKSHAICYMAPMLIGLILAYRGRYWWGGALFALFLALSIAVGHIQITYYTGFVLAALAIGFLVKAVKEGMLRRFALASAALVVGALFAFGANFNRLYNTWDYGRESIRGVSELAESGADGSGGLDKSYATSWSYGKAETLNLLVPNLVGGASGYELAGDSHVGEFLAKAGVPSGQRRQILSSMPTYWGPQPLTSGPVYIGASIILLFVLSLFLLRGPMKWSLVAVTALSIMLAWGRYFPFLTDVFFDYFPAYNKFRTVSMILVVAELTIPLLAFLGLARWTSGEVDKRDLRRATVWSLGITGGFLLLVALLGPYVASFSSPMDAEMLEGGYPAAFISAMRADRASMLRGDAFRSLIMVVAVGLLLLGSLKGRLDTRKLGILLAIVVLVDLLPVDKRYDGVHYESPSHNANPFPMTAADRAILRDTSYYRVFNTAVSPFNDASTSFYHHSLGGYHGAKLRRFQDFINHYGSSPLMLDLFNVKYVIARNNRGGYGVQRNSKAYGSVWFVDSIAEVASAQEEIAALADYNLRRVAVVRASEGIGRDEAGVVDTRDTIFLRAHSPNSMVYESSSQGGRFAVFSEVYYPRGWTARIDGEAVPIYRVDYLLRGLHIPAGKHVVDFHFELPMFFVGQWVDFLFGLCIVLTLLLLTVLHLYKRNGRQDVRVESNLARVGE